MMNRPSNLHTLGVLLTLIPILMVNTYCAGVLDIYNEWWAWGVIAVAVVSCTLAIRLQHRLRILPTIGLLLLPFGTAALGAVL